MKRLIPVLLLVAGCGTSGKLMTVNVPVTDLRAKPHTTAQADVHDPLQETQLIYGEKVRVREIENGWARVEAVEQKEYTHGRRWEGYPGWVPASDLIPAYPLGGPNVVVTDKWVTAWDDAFIRKPSQWRFPLGTRLRAIDMGQQVWRVELANGGVAWMAYDSGRELSMLRALPPNAKRQAVLERAALMIGDAYYWGGRTPLAGGETDAVTGVDCSGLVNLAYRTAGIDVPRDAHEQYLRAKPTTDLKPADLIFLSAPGNPERIVHVMLYAGDGQIIEGPGTGTTVRRIAISKRFGQPKDWVAPGSVINEQSVYFGTYLP